MSWQRRLSPLPLHQVSLGGPFWKHYQDTLVTNTLPHIWNQLNETPRMANFRRAAGREEGKHEGICFDDSDVYKWLEACAYGLAIRKSSELHKSVDEAIDLITSAQQPDGYLNTYFQLNYPNARWHNLSQMHEMYCGGHLLEAAAAWKECHNDDRLLKVAIEFVDHVMSVFGPDKRLGYCGHEEFEYGLVRLAKVTGDEKYREFARWQVESRGHKPSAFEGESKDPIAIECTHWRDALVNQPVIYTGEYHQDHLPIREHTSVVGHAVRAMYLYRAATDLADGLNDEPLEQALIAAWESLTQRRMYITGGIGPSSHNEGFTHDYDLPNLTSYAETCAAVGLALWGQNLLEVTANADFGDIVERALYNGVLSGISIDGKGFFYANPHESRGTHARTPWFGCACCPPNIARVIGGLSDFVVGASRDTFFVHIPTAFEAKWTAFDQPVRVVCESEYPWSGKVTLRVETNKPVEFTIAVRIPGWSEEMEADMPDGMEEAQFEEGYALFTHQWMSTDRLLIDFGMVPTWAESNARVLDNLGRVALTCGPIVYAAESVDNNGRPPQTFSVDPEADMDSSTVNLGLLTTAWTAQGYEDVAVDATDLYQELGSQDSKESTLKMIPYFAWANRGKAHMQVWLRRS